MNMGVNGLLGMLYIFLSCGDLNGPTLGGIFTIIGFSAMGKHAFNIVPVMIGVALGAYGIHQTLDYPSLQLAGLWLPFPVISVGLSAFWPALSTLLWYYRFLVL